MIQTSIQHQCMQNRCRPFQELLLLSSSPQLHPSPRGPILPNSWDAAAWSAHPALSSLPVAHRVFPQQNYKVWLFSSQQLLRFQRRKILLLHEARAFYSHFKSHKSLERKAPRIKMQIKKQIPSNFKVQKNNWKDIWNNRKKVLKKAMRQSPQSHSIPSPWAALLSWKKNTSPGQLLCMSKTPVAIRHGLKSAQMQPVTPGIDDRFPTAIWQAKLRCRQASGTPQGYTTNSGQAQRAKPLLPCLLTVCCGTPELCSVPSQKWHHSPGSPSNRHHP